MHRTLIYIGSLIVFFLMWGAFSFLIREPQTESTSRTMLSSIESNPIRPKGTTAAAIPITAGPQTARPDLLSDGLAGLAVLTMILIIAECGQ